MSCGHARRLFGACWDDEITQAEREWLETHFAACPKCRTEYDQYSRALELLASLPRVEPAPDLVERALARSRRVASAPDRVAAPRLAWVPVTAAAALAALAFGMISPWIAQRAPALGPVARVESQAPAQPVLRTPASPQRVSAPVAKRGDARTGDPLAAVSDSLFDHSADVEFILDPMTLQRGRPATLRPATAVQGQQATITF